VPPANPTPHVLVKPTDYVIATNAVITTTLRTYYLALVSTGKISRSCRRCAALARNAPVACWTRSWRCSGSVPLSRLETSSALAPGCGDARCRRLDLPSTPLVELGSGSDRREILEGAALDLQFYRAGSPSGRCRGAKGRGRARPGSGDALVAVIEPADLGNGADPAA
jgi:hypothetical protein